jgi:hypothetical protein
MLKYKVLVNSDTAHKMNGHYRKVVFLKGPVEELLAVFL